MVHKHQWTNLKLGELIDTYGSSFVSKNIGSLYSLKSTSKAFTPQFETLRENVPGYIIESVILMQKYVRRYLIQKNIKIAKTMVAEGVEFKTDLITAEQLEMPVVIVSDWEKGNRIIYNCSTLFKCAVTKNETLFYYLDENGEQQEKSIRRHTYTSDGLCIYVSPYTRELFTLKDLCYLNDAPWFFLGQLIQ